MKKNQLSRKGRLLIALSVLIWALSQFSASAQSNSLRRPISPSQPMWIIHIDSWNYADPQKIIDLIPQDVRPYVVMDISLSISHDVATSRFKVAEYGYEIAKSWVRTCAENQMWCFIQPSSGGYSQFSDSDLSVYREFFQNYPNFLGFNYAEQFWGYDDPNDPLSPTWTNRMTHLANLLGLCNQYGGYLVVSWCGNQWSPNINPIGMMKRNASFATACRNYTENYILCEKYTQQSYQSDMESLCLGAYLSGYSGQYGCRYDDTGWTDPSGTNTNFTMATAGAVHLEHVMLTGQTVLDGPELIWTQCFRETNRVSTTDGYYARNWETFPQFNNVSVDIFRKILDGTVRIPSRQEVINRTKYVIVNDVNSGTSNDIYSSPQTMFEGLYRMDGDGNYEYNKTFFKKTGRYPTIPTVYQLDDAVANSFQYKINRSAFSTRWPTVASKTTEFNNQFPPEYTGTIYAGRHENGWVVYNPFKTITTATGNIPFKYNTCASMDLSFSQYTAGVVKEYSNKLSIYLSNYDNVINTGLKTDIIKINGCSAEPTYTYTDRGSHQASAVSKTYSNGVLTLTVNHNGPIDITINCSGSATGRSTSYTTANLSAPARPSVYAGQRQYEAECFEYKNITGITTSGYNGSIRNYTGQGYLEFGTSSTACVRDIVTTAYAGTYPLNIKYTTVGSNVTTIDLYVNGVKVATPTFTATSNTSTWATKTQNVTLNAGSNTIELKANATRANTIYFDNMVVATGGSNELWLEAECANTLGSLWDAPASSTASSGAYIRIQAGNNSTQSAPTNSNGYATYNFNIASAGTYNLWARVRTPSASDDSFWIKIDNGSWINWNGIKSSSEWNWDILPDAFYLGVGSHTITVGYREDGTDLDKLYIGNVVPTSYGGTANNCEATSTIEENTTGFCSVDGSIATTNTGYTGSGYADTDAGTGKGITWTVNIPTTSSYTIKWRYASSTDRPANIKVDGTIVASNIAFASTGGWITWVETGTTTITLAAGSRVIRIEATTTSGLGNIDNMTITGISPAGVACAGVKSAQLGESEIDIKEQPIVIKTEYFNLIGQPVNYTDQLKGIYIVRIHMSDGSIISSKKLIR